MTVVTITGIRPDFIRMSRVFEKLDENFNHVMIHTGQHYDDELSKIFFQELKIRKPDFILHTGKSSKNHFEQLSYLSTSIIELIKKEKINPGLILFLGDSNSVLASLPLFKEGYKIAHIEGGMRSYDRRMPEEVNRVVCDYVSDLIFVYTPLYKERLIRENKPSQSIFVVGNTITEVVKDLLPTGERSRDYLVADIHRNENLSSIQQYNHILTYLDHLGDQLRLPVKLVKFNRGVRLIEEGNLLSDKKNIQLIGPYGFLKFLELQYNSYGVVSDSGTAQEECPLLGVPAAIPRESTERPESFVNRNSIMVGEDREIESMVNDTIEFFKSYSVNASQLEWLGDGKTSGRIIEILKKELST